MRRNIILIAIFVFGNFFISPGRVLSVSGDIIINEIAAYPTSTHEWIEIWNKGSEAVDLTGWKFWEDSTSHGLNAASTSDASVAPGEYAVICQNDNQFLLDYPGFSGSVFDSSWGSLNESGEEIGLKDGGGSFVEKFTYLPAPNFSLERKNPLVADYTSANWAEHASGNTVGAVNSNFSTSTGGEDSTSTVATATLWAQIKINEAVSDPESGNEWVEFYNPATSSLNLAGGYLCDSRGTTSTADCKDLSGSIGALGWLQFSWSGYFLNNDGDSVILKNPEAQILDRMDYGDGGLTAPDKGQALARKNDGVDTDSDDDWSLTTEPTPGAANVIQEPTPPSSGGGTGTTDFSQETEQNKPATSTNKTATTTAKAKAKEKEIGLVWSVKYDPRVRVGEKTVLDAGGSLDPRGGRKEMAWFLGEGAPLEGEKIEHTFVSSGLHDIVVFVTTTAGTVDSKKLKIMVYPSGVNTGAGVRIDKILPNTIGEDKGEFIAIKNITSSTINISNWKILTSEKIYNIPTSTNILAGDSLVFYHAVTGLVLANTGGLVELRDEGDILADSLEYGKAKEGQLIGESASGTKMIAVTEKQNTAAKNIKTINAGAAIKNYYGQIAIEQARGLAAGGFVKVRGVVTALPGVFGTQFFYISDGQSGLQVYQYKKDFPELKIGDSVQVQGELSEAQGVKRLKLKNRAAVDILAVEQTSTPAVFAVGELSEDSAGALIKVQGEITGIKTNQMYIDDGTAEFEIYFKRGAQIDKKKLQVGENVEVTGVLERSANGLQIWPRSNEDIASLGPSEDLLKEQQLASAGKPSDTAEKYLTATAGGITTLLLGFLVRARGTVFLSAGKRILAFLSGIAKRG